MPDISWPIVASLIGGGAAGAIITAAVTAYRNRRQPVGFRVDTRPVFRESAVGEHFSVTVSVTSGESKLHYSNLFIVSVELVNRGSRDMPQFRAGFTLADNDDAILMEAFTPDRHHMSSVAVAPIPLAPLTEIDVTLAPFNRGDSYRHDIYIVNHRGADPGLVKIGSAEPVVFKPMPTLGELAAAAAKGVQLQLGPFQVRLSK
jgi:hypothetical protein